jgi:hypothetical protein
MNKAKYSNLEIKTGASLTAKSCYQQAKLRASGHFRGYLICNSKGMKKRAEKYEAKLHLKKEVEFQDLLNVALQPPKKQAPKAKRAKGKKK